MQAIVLAGGYGTRLRTVVGDLPKPLAPIQGRPFLAYLLDDLEAQGFGVVVLAISWLGSKIRATFGARYGALELRYSEEAEPLGTGGAILAAFEQIDVEAATVINGDTFQRVSYQDLHGRADRESCDILLAVRHIDEAERYGTVKVSAGKVVRFVEKGLSGPGLINAGIYVVRRTAFAGWQPGTKFSFEQDVLHLGAPRGIIAAYEVTGDFIDIGVPADYDRAQGEIPRWTARR